MPISSTPTWQFCPKYRDALTFEKQLRVQRPAIYRPSPRTPHAPDYSPLGLALVSQPSCGFRDVAGLGF